MRVKILKPGAGPFGARHPGQVCEVPDAEGAALVADGAARELPAAPKPAPAGPTEAEQEAARILEPVVAPVEKAVAPSAPERAVARGGKGEKAGKGKSKR